MHIAYIVASSSFFDLLDGNEFEDAIRAYLNTFKPGLRYRSSSPALSSDYVPAERFSELATSRLLRTEEEQKLDPYPENLAIHCHSDLLRKKSPGQNATKDTAEFYWEDREEGFPCRVLDRVEEEHIRSNAAENNESNAEGALYKVEMKVPSDELGILEGHKTFTYIQRKNVTRRAIKFFNRPYTTDLHLRHTFRHPIGIPAEILPSAWKNAKKPIQSVDEVPIRE